MDAIPTLPKHKYVNRYAGVGTDLKLDTKHDFDEEKEKEYSYMLNVGEKVMNVSVVNPCGVVTWKNGIIGENNMF